MSREKATGSRLSATALILLRMVNTDGAEDSPINTPRSRRRPLFQSSRERKRRAKQNTMEATVCAHPKRRLGPALAPKRANTSHTPSRANAAYKIIAPAQRLGW